MATLEEYEAAKAELAALEERWDAYSGNNPDKYRSSIDSARSKVRVMEMQLKASGVLPKTPQEELSASLEAAFPNAQSKQIVEFAGKRYMRKFTPAGYSKSGVKWEGFWQELPPQTKE